LFQFLPRLLPQFFVNLGDIENKNFHRPALKNRQVEQGSARLIFQTLQRKLQRGF
jgi:hypothetical protein